MPLQKLPPKPPGQIGEKTVDCCVGKVEAERRASLRLQGGQLQQAKRNQVMTQLVVHLYLPLFFGIPAFLGLLTKRVAENEVKAMPRVW